MNRSTQADLDNPRNPTGLICWVGSHLFCAGRCCPQFLFNFLSDLLNRHLSLLYGSLGCVKPVEETHTGCITVRVWECEEKAIPSTWSEWFNDINTHNMFDQSCEPNKNSLPSQKKTVFFSHLLSV